MMNQDASRATRRVLSYPAGGPPDLGQAREIAHGVHWIRMPLAGALSHINLWALDDGGGWAIVDTGLRSDETTAAWCQLHSGPLAGRPVTRVFVTHMHPDHTGMAGWLTRKHGCRMWMTRLEYLTCRMLVADTGREAPADAISFYRQAGWDGDAIERYRARFGNFGKMTYALPDSYRRLQDGDVVTIGAHDWQVIVGGGHTPEHACLYCPVLALLISGDQVLPRISSNVSVHPTEPDADPLADWLASLDEIKGRVPDDVLVLPAHDEPFRGLHARLAQLAEAEVRVLGRLRDALREPRRVVDLFGVLFGRSIAPADAVNLSLATGECIAHLNHLVQRGEATIRKGADGVGWYCAA
jgi:glyoxylase-like metal-dependent hydrolase (beta-lactamase superfamily II)